MTSNPQDRARYAACALATALLAIVLFAVARPEVRPSGLMRDFNAFYCAGRAVADRADPYRMEPIGSCEREPKPSPLLAGMRGLAMPAPLPPYALLPFVAFARLPYVAATIVWGFCIVLAVGVTVFAVRRATNAPLVPLVAAFALTEGYASLCLGQVAPFAVAAIAVGAMLLRERRDEAAALALACAMIEPHIGLPACLAAFVWRSRTRAILVAAALGCALVSLALVGLPTTLEYVRAVLPAHALSEVVNEKQFSLTYGLHRLGVSDASAVRAGAWWYAMMLVAGALLARGTANRSANDGAIAAIPPAIALIGGPFVHIIQMSAALPAAFILYRYAAGNARRAIGLAIVALAIPWIQFLNLGTIFVVLAPLAAAVLVGTLVDRRPRIIAAGAMFALLFIVALTGLLASGIADATPALLAGYDPRALAEASWTIYVHAIGTVNVRAFDAAKIPTFLGLIVLAATTTVTALRPMKSIATRTLAASKQNGADASRRIATS